VAKPARPEGRPERWSAGPAARIFLVPRIPQRETRGGQATKCLTARTDEDRSAGLAGMDGVWNQALDAAAT